MSAREFRASAQGSLDALCGIYAIINACDLMFGRSFDYQYRSLLFKKLTNLLDDGRPIGEIIHEGISFRKLGELIDVASRTIALDHGFEITRSVAWKTSQGKKLDDFWELLHEHVAPTKGRVVLLGVDGKHSHWTVVERVSPKALNLADSDSLKRLHRSHCDLGLSKTHQLCPTQTYLLEAIKSEGVK